jgi:hypothetical protein
MDLRVSAVTLDIDLAFNGRGTSTDFLENIVIIGIPNVPGIDLLIPP